MTDLLDERGRMRRIALSFVIAVAAAALVYFICDSIAKPEAMQGGLDGGHQSRAFGFVYYMTALAFAVCFVVPLRIQKHFADKKYRESLGPPQAKIHR